jgi:hypothetical protein
MKKTIGGTPISHPQPKKKNPEPANASSGLFSI